MIRELQTGNLKEYAQSHVFSYMMSIYTGLFQYLLNLA